MTDILELELPELPSLDLVILPLELEPLPVLEVGHFDLKA